VSNPGTSTVYVNGDNVTLQDSSAMGSDDSAFFTNVLLNSPFTGGSGTGSSPVDLFSIIISPAAPVGTYDLNFLDVLGGSDGNAQGILADVPFTVVVTAPAVTPEPASFALFALGFIALGALGRKRRPASYGPRPE
jgi:hypothetical protein